MPDAKISITPGAAIEIESRSFVVNSRTDEEVVYATSVLFQSNEPKWATCTCKAGENNKLAMDGCWHRKEAVARCSL